MVAVIWRSGYVLNSTLEKKKAIWNRMTYFLILSIGIIEKNGLP